MTPASARPSQKLAFVPETRFGLWFLSTLTWRVHVLGRALTDLQRLAPDAPRGGAMLDIGTGQGHSLPEMAERFAPVQIHALDPEPDFEGRFPKLADAAKAAESEITDEETFPDGWKKVVSNCGGCHKKFRKPHEHK